MKIVLVSVSDGTVDYGIVSLASYLKAHSNFDDIQIMRINKTKDSVNQADIPIKDSVKRILNLKPDVIGISTMSLFYGKAIELAKAIRKNEEFKGSKIIIGGVHISTLPTSLDKAFDYGIVGEGEETSLELLNYIHQNRHEDYEQLQKIKGLIYWKEGTLKFNEKRPLIETLDKLPIPHSDYTRFGLIPKYINGKKVNTTVIMTSRGCPYNCSFCSTTVFWGNRVRFFSPERVVEEIEMWHKQHKVSHICIADDLFTINKDRIRKIMGLLDEKQLLGKISYECYARSDLIDGEICELLKKLDVYVLNFGFESGSQRVLADLKKNTVTVEHNKKAIKLAKKYGLRVGGSIIYGSPGEKIEDMEKTLDFVDFCIKNKVDNALWSLVMTPFPGTEVWEIAKKRGSVSDDMDWSKLTTFDYNQPRLLDSDVSHEDFRKIWLKNKQKQKYFLMRIWLRNFRKAPFKTTATILRSFKL